MLYILVADSFLTDKTEELKLTLVAFLNELISSKLSTNLEDLVFVISHNNINTRKLINNFPPWEDATPTLYGSKRIISIPIDLLLFKNKDYISKSPLTEIMESYIENGKVDINLAKSINVSISVLHELGHEVLNSLFKDTPIGEAYTKNLILDERLFSRWATSFSESFADSFSIINWLHLKGDKDINTVIDILEASRTKTQQLTIA